LTALGKSIDSFTLDEDTVDSLKKRHRWIGFD